jgi:cell fate (sporulation/competence/biofilm development) regulator YlbF (YheA/YmcA/DUF963 family)|tara:strand:+ start:176 stop:877 length:702 start_codon:yes stop_codon:yes gene_type:complete
MAFKMKGFPLIKGTSPAKKYVSDAQRKAVHASKAEKSAAKFNEGLRKASAEGKLDDNPKFKAAVDKSPINLKEGKEPSAVKLSEKDKKKAMDNAMPEAKVRSRTYQDLQADKKAMKESQDRLKVAKQKAATGGDPEKEAYNKAKARERKIQSQLDISPLKLRKADTASVTNRLNEGDKKGASLERRRGKAASKGKTGKAKRLARKLAAHDAKDNRGKQPARTTEVKQGGRIQF